MVEKVKSPVWILVVLILISLSLAGNFFFRLKKEETKVQALQTELDEVKEKQRITEARLTESKKAISNLESEIQKTRIQIETITDELEREKATKQEALTQIEQLKQDMEQQKALRTDLEDKLNQAQDEIKKAKAQLKELEDKKIALETKIKELEAQKAESEGVELGKIVVTPESKEQEGASKKAIALEGKVLVINKDYNFAVINLGSKDDVDVGNIFSVYHDNKYIGDIRVEKVHDAMSAADFVSLEIKDKINEGDKVIPKTK